MGTREKKYPDTKTFHYFNANPHHRIGCDCSVRAICTALGQTWEQTVREMTEVGIKHGYVIDDPKTIDKYLEKKGWTKNKQPRKPNNTKYTGKEWCRKITREREDDKFKSCPTTIIANIGGHHIVCIRYDETFNYRVNDIWDSTDGCIGNYWTL